MHVYDLRCEYKSNPLGLDAERPRFSWKLRTDSQQHRGLRQTAYRLSAASSLDELVGEQSLIWDSGKVDSDQSVLLEYDGPALRSRQRVYWRVRIWDEASNESTAEPAWFEMGLLNQAKDWQRTEWIGSPLYGGRNTTSPSPFLRKAFTLPDEPTRARLYCTALGVYSASINGRSVSDALLAPGSTDYRKRIQYQTYDVTSLLHAGDNAIGAILGDGWYCGSNNWYGRQMYGDRPKLFARLEITGKDGALTVVTTDSSWKTTIGPILESDLLMGESYDARRELGAWDQAGYDYSAWFSVLTFPGAAGEALLAATPGPAVRRQEEIKPVAAPVRRSGDKWIFDLGQNMVGRARLSVSGPAGTTITMRFVEMLQPNGDIYTENLRTAKQTDRYTLKGLSEEIYEPQFTFHGFRYVELSGYPGDPSVDAITGIVTHSDMERAGSFECSEPLVNQLQHNIEWGLKGNFVDVPTDCPQRDERLGWTGDAQVFISTATFNRNVAPFFTKWLRDLADSQDENGHFPMVAPTAPGMHTDGGPAWADAGVICPWTIYKNYGDKRVLAEHYSAMRTFVDSMEREAPDMIRCNPERGFSHGFGDWLSHNAYTPQELIGTAFFAYSSRLLSETAAALGNEDDRNRYAQLSERVKQAFVDRFVTLQGVVTGQSQTAYVLALHFDLLPAGMRTVSINALKRDIVGRGTHLSTGFVGTPYLLQALTDNESLDLAYELLLQKTYPSWLYPVTNGATTIWERWDGWTDDKGFQDAGMNSFNHYAYGAVGDWLYQTVAGIKVDLDTGEAGYKRIRLEPRVGGGFTHARATHESPYGEILSSWKIDRREFLWEVVVPPNTTATAVFPATKGEHVTESDMPLSGATGVSNVRVEAGVVSCTLEPGHYEFNVRRAI